MMTLYLTRKAGTEPILLSLPATPADIGNAFAELDAICQDPSATEIYKVDSEVRNLSRYICNVNVEDSENLRKLNQLAELLQSMSREDQMKMEGVLDSNSINGISTSISGSFQLFISWTAGRHGRCTMCPWRPTMPVEKNTWRRRSDGSVCWIIWRVKN